jgi:hypothetical protein
MSNEAQTFALKITLDEIKKVCPDISNTFIFGEEAKILAKDDDTDDETVIKAADALNATTERHAALGGIDSITFQTDKGRVNLAQINSLYVATISSKESDEKTVNSLTRVIVPTVLRIMEKINPESTADQFLKGEEPEPADEDSEKTLLQEVTVTSEEPEQEPFLEEATATQFMIETLGGLLVPSDTVRIDDEVISQWKDFYGDRKINQVEVETLNGQTTRCKFKPIKDSKHNGKGVVQMPQKIQLTLQTSNGELVMVRPIV